MAGQRHEKHFREARRHSFMVGFLKGALPVVAFALVAGFIALSLFGGNKTVTAPVDTTGINNGKLIMVEPKMKGFNAENRPYDLDARQAVQDLKKPGIISLDAIVAKLPSSEEGFALINAKSGTYNSKKELLKLKEDIVVTRGSGTKIMLDTASINLKNGHLTSNDPVQVTTTNSNIRSDEVEVIDNGAVIIFKKRVRMTINQAPSE